MAASTIQGEKKALRQVADEALESLSLIHI